MDVAAEVLAAEERIRPEIRETLLLRSDYFSDALDAEIHFKLENLQLTGSFKIRGALNKVLSLTDEDLARGVVSASSGNHGAAVSLALAKTGARGTVFVPQTASRAKVENIERLGGQVEFFGFDTGVTETHARQFAVDNNLTFIAPYNDRAVIGGQGTIGVELLRQLEALDAVFVAVGGGGLISGIAGYLASRSPSTRVFGVSPTNSKVMIESIRAGHILDLESEPTLSDGTAGGVEPDSLTFDIIRSRVHELVTVSEEEIRTAMLEYMSTEHQLIEGAAGTAIAGMKQCAAQLRGCRVAVIVSGANISHAALKQLL